MKLRPDFPRPVCAAGALWLVLAVLPFTARADGPFALTSSATNSYAFVPHNPALNAFPLTVTAWVKRSQATNSFPLVTKYDSASQNGWQVYVTNGSLRASYSDNSLISVSLDGGILRTDIWQQVAFVVNTGLAQLYVDGQLKGSLEWTGSACTNGLEMRLGCYQGALDEVSIWNVAQPPNWIATNSDRGWLGTEPGLVSYYRLNEGGGSVVIDSASGLNGIVTNGATWVSGITLRPAVMTQPPSTVTNTVATLQGSANPGVTNTSAWFEWGTSTSYGNVTAPQPLGSGASNSNFLQVLNGLTAGTTYNYRAVASNSVGISYGDNASFTTPGNSALSFDGVSSFVSVPHSIVLDPFAMTATAWIKTTQATGEVGVINKYVVGSLNGWQMFLYNGEVRAWYFGDGTHYIWDGGRGLNGGQVTNGAWHHIAFTMDGSGGKLYVDGTLKDSMLWTGVRTTCTTTQPLSFARYPGSGFFKGAIDEVTIWNLAQPPDWLFSNLDRGWVGSEPGLLAYYRLNEGTGLVASNSAPGGGVASGSLSNGPVWVAGIGLRPGLLTLTPIAVTSFGATLRGIANPENAKTTAWFEWGVSTNYGNVTSSQALGSGNENVTFSQALSGLTAGALYHYRAVASNSLGVSLGGDQLIFPGGNLAVGRAYFTLTPLPNGKVLAAGGMFTGYIPLATAELYDPASGTWSDTQPMNFPRWDHTATLLPNGRVLVTGGFSSGGGLGVPELYDPATGIWSLVASMSTNRIQHTATLLPNGKVLVAGGYSETSGGFV